MKKELLAGILSGLLVLGAAGSVFAQNMQGPDNPPPLGKGAPMNYQDGIKNALGGLVIDGVLNRDQAVRVMEYFKKHAPPPGKNQGQPPKDSKMAPGGSKEILNSLVKDHVITPEQAMAIEKALWKMMPPPGKPGDGPGKNPPLEGQ